MEYIMDYLKNYFYRFKEKGNFEIRFNTITRDGADLKGQYVTGQYVKIIGSTVNDGVYKVIATEEDGIAGMTLEGCTIDENFTGYICSLGVPKSFIKLSEEIQAYNSKEENRSGIVSESFGGYSYSKAVINGEIAGWKTVFKASLAPYRKMTDGFGYIREIK